MQQVITEQVIYSHTPSTDKMVQYIDLKLLLSPLSVSKISQQQAGF